jgi:hypothetical protein
MKLKWFFAALVLANIGLWMWGSWYREPPVQEERPARAPIAPEKMRLLNEAGVKLQPRKAPPPANAELAANAPQVCLRIGPFPDTELTAKAEATLNEWHLGFARRPEETKTITGYRVFLPAMASKEAAERKRKELTRLGFKDHAVIQEEGWNNAISLGLFSVEANAESRVRELAAKGVAAKSQPLYQTRTLYWLDSGVPVPADVAAKMKQADWGAKEIQAQETACPAVTTPGPPPAPVHEPFDNAPS